MRKLRKGWKIPAAAAAAAVILIAALSFARGTGASLESRIANSGEIIGSVRQGLKEHSAKITVSFSWGEDVLAELSRLTDQWMEKALEETEDPAEGDYIRYQYGGYSSACSYEVADGQYEYTVEIVPDYYLYLAQEEMVTEKLAEIFAGFDFSAAPDYEKIRVIYDYLCQNVRYDKVHLKNPYNHTRSTAYAALVQGGATCQGYCVSLYRMLRTAGINTRIVTGTGKGEEGLHAWNIVELDGLWYNVDATWDAGREEYSWFLKGSGDFPDHVPGEEFLQPEFAEQYPLAETAYGAENP